MAAEDEFEEEEIWAAVKDHGRDHWSPHAARNKSKDVEAAYGFTSSKTHHHSSPSKMIQRGNASGSLSLRSSSSRQSAPVNIPDWSKIYQRKGNGSGNDGGGDENGNDDGDDDEEKVPPHEWLARKMARSQISSSSVCEGAGRTLKGRDLSRVRNAVLTRTGFLE